ncbi:MAG: asparaginase, partial [Pseudomonadales bacterium]
MHTNPVLVDVKRNGVVESQHRGSAVVSDADGNIIFSIGDWERNFYPRSAIKPLQAIPIIESGAGEAYSLSDAEISLACASHNSEDIHVNTVDKWLARLALSESDLECGAELPLYKKAAHKMIANGESPNKMHHNCSGKHSGMLTLARHLLPDVKGYSLHENVIQQIWMKTLSDLIAMDVSTMHWERDGCGLPAIYMPMHKLALAFAQFSKPERQPGARGRAMTTIINAIAKHPEMIAGSERCCSAVISETKGRAIVKTGAEASFAGVIPHLGYGFVLKIDESIDPTGLPDGNVLTTDDNEIAVNMAPGKSDIKNNFGYKFPGSVAGTLFHDKDGLSDNTVDGEVINTPNGVVLYAHLIDGSDKVVQSVPISVDGTYNFINVAPGDYTVEVSTEEGTRGLTAP